MTANELYRLTPKRTTKEICNLYKHIDKLDPNCEYEANDRVEIKEIVSYCFDGRRVWDLNTVWFDGMPVMVIQEAGRDGDDHTDNYVTDYPKYREMVNYILSLPKDNDNCTRLNPDTDEPNLTTFYNHTLSDFYDPDFVPEHKVGDILEIMIPEDYLNWWNSKEQIKVRVKILNVYDIPYDTYRVMELDRKIHYGTYGNKEDKTFIIRKEDIPNDDTMDYENIYHRINCDLELLIR